MRGQQKLFADLIELPKPTEDKQGRSAELHGRRNECLIYRYHYYLTQPNRFAYTTILDILCREFFLAQFTIQERIDENYDLLLKLRDSKPDHSSLKKRWPHLVW